MAGPLISKGSANSETVASPETRRARIARRVGSASAPKVTERSVDTGFCLTIMLDKLIIKYAAQSFRSRHAFVSKSEMDASCGSAIDCNEADYDDLDSMATLGCNSSDFLQTCRNLVVKATRLVAKNIARVSSAGLMQAAHVGLTSSYQADQVLGVIGGK
jgi:hypothetical protein